MVTITGAGGAVTAGITSDANTTRAGAFGFTPEFFSRAADLRTPLRQSESDEALDAAIREALSRKPKGHDFIIDRRHNRPAVARHMSVTGG